MENNLTVEVSVTINADIAKVWDALVNPAIIKQYLFGTNAISDWKVGSPITYKGEWEGKEYEDHGKILQIEPEKILKTTYWSSMSGTENMPENYVTLTYTVSRVGNGTLLTITQDNSKTEEAKEHSGSNWKMVLDKLKEILENK
jgi:uncharacterized protein YndB with AHSA1/START domain